MDYATALDLAIRSFHIPSQVERGGPTEDEPTLRTYSIPGPRDMPTTEEIIARADAFYEAGKGKGKAKVTIG